MNAQASGQEPLILVVDDEELIRMLMRAVLEAKGWRVLCASGGEEAVALYDAHRPAVSLVLVDQMMPKMDGTATVRALRQIDPSVRVVLVSGGNAPDVQPPPSGFLLKPFQTRDLVETVRKALAAAV